MVAYNFDMDFKKYLDECCLNWEILSFFFFSIKGYDGGQD